MKGYQFKRLIKKYSSPFQVEVKSGVTYDEYGDPVSPTTEVLEDTGAVMALSSHRIYQSGGALSSQDRELYMSHALPDPLEGTTIIYEGQRYSVELDRDYHQFSSIYIYLMKRVEKGDRPKEDHPDSEDGADGSSENGEILSDYPW